MKKKIMSILLVAVLAMSMAACGAKSEKAESTSAAKEEAAEEESVAGTYWAVLDSKDAMNQELSAMGITLSNPVPLRFDLVLGEDDSFRFTADAQSYKDSIVNAVVADIDGLIASLLGMEELDEEMAEMIAQGSGYDNYEAFKEDMVKQMTDEMSSEDSGMDDMNVEGTYKVSGKTIGLLGSVEGEMGFDSATLQDDGTILLKTVGEGVDFELNFVKGNYADADEAAIEANMALNKMVITEAEDEAA